MKKIILYILIIIELTIFKIPKYVELNNIAIIEEISLIEKYDKYTLTLKETIPIKDEQGIKYKYKEYKKTASTPKKAYQLIEKSTKKRLYLKKTKSLKTNILITSKIIKELNINPKIIIHYSKDQTY